MVNNNKEIKALLKEITENRAKLEGTMAESKVIADKMYKLGEDLVSGLIEIEDFNDQFIKFQKVAEEINVRMRQSAKDVEILGEKIALFESKLNA